MREGLTCRCGDWSSAKQSWIYHGTHTGAAGTLVGVSVRAAKPFRDQLQLASCYSSSEENVQVLATKVSVHGSHHCCKCSAGAGSAEGRMGSGFRWAVWRKTSALEALQERLELRYFGATKDDSGPGLCDRSDRWCPGQTSCGIWRRGWNFTSGRRNQTKVWCSWRFMLPLIIFTV